MKYLLLGISLFVFNSLVYAANVAISIGGFQFSPNNPTVNVGDVITWTNLDTSPHSIQFTAVPATATGGTSPTLSQNGTFTYTVLVAGNYTYRCGIHNAMTGAFTATATTPVLKPVSIVTHSFPNPAVETLHLEASQTIRSVEIYSEAGILVKTLMFSNDKIDLPVGDLAKGIYLIKVIGEGAVFETKRIVKE